MPVTKRDGSVIAAAGGLDAAAVLLRAINVVRELIVHGHVIELRRGLVVPRTPAPAVVHAHAHALVAAENHALRVGRINPQGVIIIAAGSALDSFESLARVAGPVKRNVGQV